MDGMNIIEAATRRELVELVERHTGFEGARDILPGLRLARATHPTESVTGVYRPSLCLVAQGAKQFFVGDAEYRYDPERYLIATIEMPLTGRVVEASPSRPYLSMRLDLDPGVVSSVMVESGLPSPQANSNGKAIYVSRVTPNLLDPVVRLLRLLDEPASARVLRPLVEREIVFRLLTGEQGERLRHLPMMSAHSHRIAKAVAKLRKNYHQPISIEALAKELGMSPSGFHHHFRSVMDMSPLQFQKLIRLQEARQIMLSENLDASSAGRRVGYDDASHFSRDYKRQFGDAPIRDTAKLRERVAAD